MKTATTALLTAVAVLAITFTFESRTVSASAASPAADGVTFDDLMIRDSYSVAIRLADLPSLPSLISGEPTSRTFLLPPALTDAVLVRGLSASSTFFATSSTTTEARVFLDGKLAYASTKSGMNLGPFDYFERRKTPILVRPGQQLRVELSGSLSIVDYLNLELQTVSAFDL